MTRVLSPQPFDLFLQSVASANYEDYRYVPGAAVEDARAFDEMRAYVLDLYSGVRADVSFVENDGQILDCVPAELHPAVSKWNDGYTAEPPAPPVPEDPESYGGDPPRAASPAITTLRNVLARPQYRDPTDTFPAGTTPVYRTTLEQLSRFRNLAAFSAKDNFVGGPSAAGLVGTPTVGKRYATGEEDVA